MIGLDIGTAAVKAARVDRKGDRYTVTGLARVGIEAAASPEGAHAKTVEAIQRCLYVLGRRSDVVCGLSGPDIAIRMFDLPALPKKQLPSAVELEAAQICPFDIHEAAVSFQVLHRARARKGKTGADRTTGILAAAKKPALTHLQDLCKEAKARCIIVDVEGLALLNCLEAGGTRLPGQAVLVVNIGHTYTNLAILGDDGQPFVQDLAYAGAAILEGIGRSAKATPEAVVAALSGAGKEARIDPQALQAGLETACGILAERIRETVRYHGARQAGAGVHRILVCGGLSEAGPVVETLAGLLEGKVLRWDPLTALRCTRAVRKGPLAGHGPLFGVALGLAMRSVRDVPN